MVTHLAQRNYQCVTSSSQSQTNQSPKYTSEPRPDPHYILLTSQGSFYPAAYKQTGTHSIYKSKKYRAMSPITKSLPSKLYILSYLAMNKKSCIQRNYLVTTSMIAGKPHITNEQNRGETTKHILYPSTPAKRIIRLNYNIVSPQREPLMRISEGKFVFYHHYNLSICPTE